MPDAMPPPSDIAHIIQLSVAPVFLLVAIGSFLNVMTARLGRVADRARRLEDVLTSGENLALRGPYTDELRRLDRRMTLANRAINLCVVAALLIAFMVALLFIGALASIDTAAPVAGLFVIAMAAIIAALAFFLLEIRIATRTVRVRAELLTSK